MFDLLEPESRNIHISTINQRYPRTKNFFFPIIVKQNISSMKIILKKDLRKRLKTIAIETANLHLYLYIQEWHPPP